MRTDTSTKIMPPSAISRPEQRERRQPFPGRERDRGRDAALGRAEPGDERHRAELHRAVERRERRHRRETRDRQPEQPGGVHAGAVVREHQRDGKRQRAARDAAPAEHSERADDARRARIGDGGRSPQERCQQAADDPRHACVPATTATPTRRPAKPPIWRRLSRSPSMSTPPMIANTANWDARTEGIATSPERPATR